MATSRLRFGWIDRIGTVVSKLMRRRARVEEKARVRGHSCKPRPIVASLLDMFGCVAKRLRML